MLIGIIGGDDRAVAIGRMLRKCGHKITYSDPNAKDAALHATQALGGEIPVTTPYEQAATCEAIVLTVHWEDIERTLAALGSYKNGLVIDATRPPKLTGTSGAELLARKLDNRHIVKAFVDNLEPGQPIRVASDDPEARLKVESAIEACGGVIEDMGPLSRAIEIERAYAKNITTQ